MDCRVKPGNDDVENEGSANNVIVMPGLDPGIHDAF
jgi:hypothetical protein